MLEFEVAIPKAELGTAVEDIIRFGTDTKGVKWSKNEDGERRVVVNRSDVSDADLRAGGFIWIGDEFVELSELKLREFASLYSSTDRIEFCRLFIEVAKKADAYFGYICDREERRYRNMISATKDYGIHQAWVGRDFTKYLPGLYWMTFLSEEARINLGIDIDKLKKIAHHVELVGNRLWIIRAYDEPAGWRSKASLIDTWCLHTEGCFNKNSAMDALEASTSFLEASIIPKKWP